MADYPKVREVNPDTGVEVGLTFVPRKHVHMTVLDRPNRHFSDGYIAWADIERLAESPQIFVWPRESEQEGTTLRVLGFPARTGSNLTDEYAMVFYDTRSVRDKKVPGVVLPLRRVAELLESAKA
ncbi:MAG TPA: hypothetical protein VGK74_22945 [Symbiobacteriaceae bacterium]